MDIASHVTSFSQLVIYFILALLCSAKICLHKFLLGSVANIFHILSYENKYCSLKSDMIDVSALKWVNEALDLNRKLCPTGSRSGNLLIDHQHHDQTFIQLLKFSASNFSLSMGKGKGGVQPNTYVHKSWPE